jgi:hypothetical protein
MLGKAAVAMWWDVAADVRSEWEDWHTHEHMPERLAIPGFLRGTRWIAASGESSYFVCYEAKNTAVLTSGAYLERLNAPSPWSQRMMPHHKNMVRSVCRVLMSAGGGVPLALATVRFSPIRGRGLVEALPAELAALVTKRGLASAHLLKADRPKPAVPTTEQKIRGGDGQADHVVLIGGYGLDELRDLVRESAALRLVHEGARDVVTGIYRPAYSLAAREMPQ